ncbi:MAG: sigma 54-interacting transcriptional regulator [Syntrophomonadaceae bacterium]|nr:sigma 54-interacting transcriptional regulator [Syntrophomonadaceae bacterium]
MAPELLVREVLDTNAMTAVIVSKDGMVEFINKTYLDILGKKEEEVVGKYIGEITPDSRTLTVLKTGKAIVGYNWSLNGHMMIACSLPLIRNGELTGCFAYSLFMDRLDARDLVNNLMTELNMYKDEVRSLLSARYSFEDIVGQAPNIEEVKYLAQTAALHPSITVLINGESGTGKELFAQAIHGTSSRSRMPFIRVNCAAIPENLLEAELFGYEEGAFTGARKGGSPGKFELANGGTIFLDEIGEMSLTMQSKLLVFLQEREFERVGSHQPIRVNVRIVAATNRNLEEMINQQKFREDLFYRLNVLTLEIPPLRKRIEDLPLLINHFIPKLNIDLKTNVTAISDEAVELLSQYNWPGNIRELVNVLQRAMLVADMGEYCTITTKQLRFMKIQPEPQIPMVSSTLKSLLKDYEKQILIQALADTNYNKTKTASVLNIDISSLYKKLKQYGLSDDS